MTDEARIYVVQPAGGEADDNAHRFRRIGLRPCDPRHCRKRGCASDQMQKLPTVGKFHFEPPFTSFDHLVGQREQRWRNLDAECLCGGQVDDEIEFSPEFDR
jgi:hypothetical protein